VVNFNKMEDIKHLMDNFKSIKEHISRTMVGDSIVMIETFFINFNYYDINGY